mmetsp:Transcript_1228/g.4132  ORF Transcript_1228/g.4132 Transcript_1228/m.4132 type:complete len:231 (-) Transcript_1228:130-822(-)
MDRPRARHVVTPHLARRRVHRMQHRVTQVMPLPARDALPPPQPRIPRQRQRPTAELRTRSQSLVLRTQPLVLRLHLTQPLDGRLLFVVEHRRLVAQRRRPVPARHPTRHLLLRRRRRLVLVLVGGRRLLRRVGLRTPHARPHHVAPARRTPLVVGRPPLRRRRQTEERLHRLDDLLLSFFFSLGASHHRQGAGFFEQPETGNRTQLFFLFEGNSIFFCHLCLSPSPSCHQ